MTTETENIKIEPQWTKSKEEIWAEKFAGLEEGAKKKVRLRKHRRLLYAGVAAVALVILLPSVAFIYTKEIVVPKGRHYTLNFPGGSAATINAESRLTYKPLWWRVSRKVGLHGEAYFRVEKGNKFEVHSPSGTVTVLGTRFNVLARSTQYNVACLAGKVKVETKNQSVILSRGMQTVLEKGILQSAGNNDIEQKISWTNNKFTFHEEPLTNVIREIERQYNIEIVAPENIDYIYSGNFTKTDNPEDILQIIQEPFGIKLKIKK